MNGIYSSAPGSGLLVGNATLFPCSVEHLSWDQSHCCTAKAARAMAVTESPRLEKTSTCDFTPPCQADHGTESQVHLSSNTLRDRDSSARSKASPGARPPRRPTAPPGRQGVPAPRGPTLRGGSGGGAAMADRLTQLQDAVNSVRRPLLPLSRGSGARHGPVRGAGCGDAASQPGVGCAPSAWRGCWAGGGAPWAGCSGRAGPLTRCLLIGGGSSRTSSVTPSECCSSAAPRPPSATSRRP